MPASLLWKPGVIPCARNSHRSILPCPRSDQDKSRRKFNSTGKTITWEIFDAAPPDIQALYGGQTFRDKVLQTFDEMNKSSGSLENPAVVVDTLRDMLALPKNRLQPYYWLGQPYYWLGADASTLYGGLFRFCRSLCPVSSEIFLLCTRAAPGTTSRQHPLRKPELL